MPDKALTGKGNGNGMNGYNADAQLTVVRQIQARYRADAAVDRLAAGATLRQIPAPAAGLVLNTARLIVAIVLVAMGVGGLAGAGTLLAGPAPVDGPTPDFAN